MLNTFNTSHFIDEKDSDASFLTNTASCVLWRTFTPSTILSMYKLSLENVGDMGGRYME